MFEIPELNHHLLEGLKNPEGNKEYLQFVFFESDLYFDRVQKRQKITQDIVDKHGIGLSRFKSTAKSALQQAFETLSFTSYAAFYLSVLNQVDPGPNPWVDYLKEELGQPLGK
jgi:glucose/mannose-6-phosphate isomerase